MSTPKVLSVTAIAAFAVFQLLGCSVIGLTAGAISDRNKPDEYVFAPSGLDSLERGSTVEVLKTDSRIVSGEYQGTDAVPSEEYNMRYGQSLHSLFDGLLMPALGDSILIVTNERTGPRAFEGKLLGFDEGVIHVHESGRKELVKWRVKFVDTLYHGTAVIPGNLLRHHLNNRDIPLMSTLLITNEQGTQRVLVSDVLEVRQPVSKGAAWKGFLIGAALDVAFATIYSLTSSGWIGGGGAWKF